MVAAPPRDECVEPHRLTKADLWVLIGVCGATAVVFLPVLWTGFAGDDYFILARLQALDGLAHPLVYFTQDFFQYYRPLTFVSQAIDWELWGRNAFGYHLTSLALHAANTGLVFLLARRMTSRWAALMAAVIFATHPAAHETVYWMAARFDLLATCLSLASLLLLIDGRPGRYWSGVAVFGFAMLSKESALALPLFVAAYDVLIDRRSFRDEVRRLVPLVLVMAAYSATRALATELAGDDARRLPKLIVLVMTMAVLLFVAWRRRDAERTTSHRTDDVVRAGLVVGLAAAAVLLAVPATAMWMAQRLGFVAYASFYLVSPVIFPGPPPETFTPTAPGQAIPGFVALVAVMSLLWWGRRVLAADRVVACSLVFIAAALIPVLSLTGSSRYVYVATAGLAVLVGRVVAGPAAARWRGPLMAVLAVYLVVSVAQLGVAAASWRWGSSMVRDGITLMSRDLAPCGTKDLVMLTAPVGIRSMYSNFYWDMFQVEGCTPVSISAVLRVVRDDAHVEVRRHGRTIEVRVSNYRGGIVTSEDLRHFDRPIVVGDRRTIRLPIGDLRTRPEHTDQLFALTLNEAAERMLFFYYSDGAMHALAPSSP